MRHFFVTQNDTEAVDQIVLVLADMKKLLGFVSQIRMALLEAKNISRSACAVSFNMNMYEFSGEVFFLSAEASDAYISDPDFEKNITNEELEEERESYSCSYMTLHEHGIEFSCEDNCDVRHAVFIDNNELQTLENLANDFEFDEMEKKIVFLQKYLEADSGDDDKDGIKMAVKLSLNLFSIDYSHLNFLNLMENQDVIAEFVEQLISKIMTEFDGETDALSDFIYGFIEDYKNEIYRRAS